VAQPFIPFPNMAQLTLQFSVPDGDIAENVFNVQRSSAWTGAGLTAMAQGLQDWWYAGAGGTSDYRQYQHSSVALVQTTARDLTTQGGRVVSVPANQASNVGASGSAIIQNGLTFSLTARTGLAGPSQRGRTFLVGLTSGFLDAGDVNKVQAAEVAVLITAFNALITKVAAVDAACTLVVASRRHNNLWRSTGQTTPITVWGYNNLNLDYQRRRAPGHGRHR
jgi:hypothetical protein